MRVGLLLLSGLVLMTGPDAAGARAKDKELTAKAWVTSDGVRLDVNGKKATLAGKSFPAELVDCLLGCDTSQRARCLVLGKPWSGHIFLVAPNRLEEVQFPGECPEGLGVDRMDKPRVFTAAP